MIVAGADVTLRPVAPGDEESLYGIYAATRTEELALTDWSDAQKEQFLRMQFAAQHSYYQEHYTDTSWDLILVDGDVAGRLYVARWPEQIRIVDIALLPPYRGRGIGGALLRGLQAEGAQTGKPVSIHVEQFNPARRLYERLGFVRIAERGVYDLMQWSPGTA
jgi:ribosomal protein S18 acetylase RimI-like enzyme